MYLISRSRVRFQVKTIYDKPTYLNFSCAFLTHNTWNSRPGIGCDCQALLLLFLAISVRSQEMLTRLFSQYVMVIRVCVWTGNDGPLAGVVVRSEWDARVAIARLHKRRMDSQFSGRRLELSLGRPSPAPNLDVLRARLRAILRDQPSQIMPLLRLRDAYASRHCCALTTSDLAKV